MENLTAPNQGEIARHEAILRNLIGLSRLDRKIELAIALENLASELRYKIATDTSGIPNESIPSGLI